MFDERVRHENSMNFEIDGYEHNYWDVKTLQYYDTYHADCPRGYRVYNDVVCGEYRPKR